MSLCPTYVLVVSVSLSLASGGGFAQHEAPLFTNALHSSTARFALERAAREALHRLERPKCGKVLSEFRDTSGRTIQETLDLSGETPRSHLARLTFREAFDRRCRDSMTLAFTYLGSREVFVCGTQFWQTYGRDPAHVEALIIHELMHTLGLGENPPSSLEITETVLKRCW